MSEHGGLQSGVPVGAASQGTGVMVVLRRLLQGRRGAMAVAMGAAALASATALSQPLIARRVVDQASHGGVSLGLAILLVAAFAVSISAEALDVYLFSRLGEDVVLDQRRAYASHLIALPVADLDHLRLGDLVARATADTTELQELPRKVSRVVIGACTLAVGIQRAVARHPDHPSRVGLT